MRLTIKHFIDADLDETQMRLVAKRYLDDMRRGMTSWHLTSEDTKLVEKVLILLEG